MPKAILKEQANSIVCSSWVCCVLIGFRLRFDSVSISECFVFNHGSLKRGLSFLPLVPVSVYQFILKRNYNNQFVGIPLPA